MHDNTPYQQSNFNFEMVDRDRSIWIKSFEYKKGTREALEYSALCHRRYKLCGANKAFKVRDRCKPSRLILGYSRDLELVGAMSVHAREHGALPIEAALNHSHRLGRLLNGLGTVYEASGLVVAEEMSGTGLSYLIMAAGIATSQLLGADTVVGLGHRKVLRLYAAYGLIPEPRFPPYPYPNQRYRSYILIMRDLATLANAHPDQRRAVSQIRGAFEYA